MTFPAYPTVGSTYGAPGVIEELGLIYGRKPQSKQEWYTAVALWRYGWGFDYQVPIRGGRLPGGQVLDFLVQTLPRPTPLQPFSVYFHKGMLGEGDRFKLDTLRQIFGVDPIVWWSDQIDTQAKALAMCYKDFGRGPGL